MRYTPSQSLMFDQGKIDRLSLSYRILTLMLALSYGGILASLPLDAFLDRANYLIYATDSWLILCGYWSQSPLVALANEPIWLLINSFLANFLSAEDIVRIIIFVPATVVAWIVLLQSPKHFNFIWMLLFLLYPAVVKNHIIHLRQGVAIAVFLMGWFSGSTPLRWFLMGSASFIHSSIFFMLALLGLTKIALKLHLGPDLRTLLMAAMGIIIGLGFGWLGAIVGARQAYYYEFTMAPNASGLGFIFWAFMFVVMCLQGRTYMRRYAFEMAAVIFYLATYFFVEVAARIFESALLLVLLAGLQLTGWRRTAFISLIIISALIQYIRQFDQPWLGYGL